MPLRGNYMNPMEKNLPIHGPVPRPYSVGPLQLPLSCSPSTQYVGAPPCGARNAGGLRPWTGPRIPAVGRDPYLPLPRPSRPASRGGMWGGSDHLFAPPPSWPRLACPSTRPPRGSVRPPARQPASPPARQPASPPARQPASPPARQPASPPARQPASPPARQPASPPARQPASPPARQPASPPARQPASPPARQPASPPAYPS